MDRENVIQEIALIRRAIDESRKFTFDNGKYYMLWGVLVTIAIFAQYAVILTQNYSLSVWIWSLAIGIGVVVSVIFSFREPSKAGAWPIGAKFIGLVWTSAFVSMMLVGIVGSISGGLRSWAICPAMAAIVGAAYTTSSLVYRLKWVMMVGIAWWLSSVAMFWVKGIATLPMYGVMMIFFQIVPGLVFYRTSKRNAEGNLLDASTGEHSIV